MQAPDKRQPALTNAICSGAPSWTTVFLTGLTFLILGSALTATWFVRYNHTARRSVPTQVAAVSQPETPQPDAAPVQAPAMPVDPAAIKAVKESIPNFETVSLDEGTQTLRNSALAQFTQISQELEEQVKAAERRFVEAKDDAAAQKAAVEDLRRIQTQATEKLKEIAIHAHAQIAALEQLKKAAP